MRDSQVAANTAGQAAAGYGSTAGGINANLTPFLTRQMDNPQGMSQRDVGAQVTAGLAGTGGATAGLTGAAGKMGADTRNPMGFSGALDAAAQQRDKGDAMVGEKIAAGNADTKLQQQSQAASGLGRLYGMNTEAQDRASGQIAPDINAAANANKTGWVQNGLLAGMQTGVDLSQIYKNFSGGSA